MDIITLIGLVCLNLPKCIILGNDVTQEVDTEQVCVNVLNENSDLGELQIGTSSPVGGFVVNMSGKTEVYCVSN